MMINYQQLNKRVADRENVFYWQTDRSVDIETATEIWSDRHKPFSDQEIIIKVNQAIAPKEVAYLEPLDTRHQNNLGNVNSIRIAKLTNDEQVIVRCHPKGVKNGYFHVESLAAAIVKEAGLPSYQTLAIHDLDEKNSQDFAFQVIEKIEGLAVTKWLEKEPGDEQDLLIKMGKTMAKIHQTKVKGFGPFDNEQSKVGKLIGVHNSFSASLKAGLSFNLETLVAEELLSNKQADSIKKMFESDSQTLDLSESVLVHNDFADWNLLTDGKNITGIIDWDECVASHPISDIACWSTFFNSKRMEPFLEGYWHEAKPIDNFQEVFELLRLRYVISKMTLRIRRYNWDPSPFIKEKIDTGKQHLSESMTHFEIR